MYYQIRMQQKCFYVFCIYFLKTCKDYTFFLQTNGSDLKVHFLMISGLELIFLYIYKRTTRLGKNIKRITYLLTYLGLENWNVSLIIRHLPSPCLCIVSNHSYREGLQELLTSASVGVGSVTRNTSIDKNRIIWLQGKTINGLIGG